MLNLKIILLIVYKLNILKIHNHIEEFQVENILNKK